MGGDGIGGGGVLFTWPCSVGIQFLTEVEPNQKQHRGSRRKCSGALKTLCSEFHAHLHHSERRAEDCATGRNMCGVYGLHSNNKQFNT